MRKIVVIPTYWSRPTNEKWQEGDAVYDHPTPIDQEGTLGRTLESMKILSNKDFVTVLLLCPTAEEILDEAYSRVKKIVDEVDNKIQTYIITPREMDLIKEIAKGVDLQQEAIDIMLLSGYANVRNMCIYVAYILGADSAILIDDDEIFENEDFIDIATEFIGGRLYGKTVDGIAGYYLNKYNKFYDDVDVVPWMTYWDRFGSKTLAFDTIIGSPPRIKPTPFAFGGAMVIHRNLFKVVPFDPQITRGEDIDYLINAQMYGFYFFLDRKLSIKHLPPKKSHPIWKRFREDIYRFLYEKQKIDTQYEVPNMNLVTPADFDPYPGNFLTDDLEDMIFKANVMLAMDYLSQGDIEAAKESMKNIYLSKYDSNKDQDVFGSLIKLQKNWRKLLKFSKRNMMQIRTIFEKCDVTAPEPKTITTHMKKATLEDIEQILKKVDFFKTLPVKSLELLAGIAQMQIYEKDENIVKIGDQNDTLYIIWSGSVRISKCNYENEEIILAKLEESDYFGENNLYNDKVFVNIFAREETTLITFSEQEILNLIKTYSDIGVELLILLNSKLGDKLENSNKRYIEAITKHSGILNEIE